MKHSRSDNNITKFRELKRKAQREIRKNYNTYIEDLIDPNTDKGNKKLWTLVKRIKRDSSGVGPLKIDGKLVSDSKEKANALNHQFQSVFNAKTQTEISDMGPSPFDPMQDYHISAPGVTKLLTNLKIYKAPGPDGIAPRL